MNEPVLAWWHGLSVQWKQAFAETVFHHSNEPSPAELAQLHAAPALRFAGPQAPYPNMSFELNDLSGIAALTNLQILVIVFQQLESVAELQALTNLKSLFMYNNCIRSLNGIENLTALEQLYVQGNQVNSLRPIENLTRLKELYVNDNRLSSLEGLTEEHAGALEIFFCKPNAGLKQKELLGIERELGIRCRGL